MAELTRERREELRAACPDLDGHYYVNTFTTPITHAELRSLLDAADERDRLREAERQADAVLEAATGLCSTWDANGFSAKFLVKDSPSWRLYQAIAAFYRARPMTPEERAEGERLTLELHAELDELLKNHVPRFKRKDRTHAPL